MLTSSDGTLTSSAEVLASAGLCGPFDVAGAARAVGPEAGEAVREALEAVERWNRAEVGARAHSHLGRAFALAVGMAAIVKVRVAMPRANLPGSSLDLSCFTVHCVFRRKWSASV